MGVPIYGNLSSLSRTYPEYSGDLSIQITTGINELRGTYLYPDLLLDLASWIYQKQ